MPVFVNPNRPLDLGAFSRLYNSGSMSPEQVESDLFFNAPTEGRSYLSDQWARTAPGMKGQSPVQFFNALNAARTAQNTPQGPTSDDRLKAMDRVRFANTGGPALTNVGVTPGQFAILQKQRGGTELEDIMTSYMPETDRKAYVADREARITGGARQTNVPSLRPIAHEELLSHPTFQRLLQTDPTRASRIFAAAHGRDLGEYIQTQAKAEEVNQQAASSTLQGLMNRGELSWKDGIPHITRKNAMGMDETKPADTLTAQMIYRALTPTRKGTTRLGLVPPHMSNAASVVKGYVMQGMDVQEALQRAYAEASPAATATAAAGPSLPPSEAGTRAGLALRESGRRVPGILAETGRGIGIQAANLGIAAQRGVANVSNWLGGMIEGVTGLDAGEDVQTADYLKYPTGPIDPSLLLPILHRRQAMAGR